MASSSRNPTTATATTTNPPRSPESHESLSRRNAAAEILQSYEKLSWYSFQRCEVGSHHPPLSSQECPTIANNTVRD